MNWIQALAMEQAATRKHGTELWERYRRLDAVPRSILQLKGLVGPEVGKTAFLAIAQQAGLRGPGDLAWATKTLNPVLEDLRRQGLLLEGLDCPPALLHPLAVEAMASPAASKLEAAVRQAFPDADRYQYVSYNRSVFTETARRLRLALYANDGAEFLRRLTRYAESHDPRFEADILDRLFIGTPVNETWLASRAEPIRYAILSVKLPVFLNTGIAEPNLPALMGIARRSMDGVEASGFQWLTALWDIMGGRLIQARRTLAAAAELRESTRAALSAALDFLGGDTAAALTGFQGALKLLRKEEGRRKLFLADPEALFFLLALLKADDARLGGDIDKALELTLEEDRPLAVAHAAIHLLRQLVRGQDSATLRQQLEALRRARPSAPLTVALLALAELAVDAGFALQHRPDTAARFAEFAETAPLAAGILAEVLARVADDPAPYESWLNAPSREPVIRFTEIVAIREPWERVLENLDVFLAGSSDRTAGPAAPKAKRLVWLVDLEIPSVEVLEQSAKSKDGWTPGRTVALKRLYEKDPRLDYLTDHDRRALRAICKSNTWYDDVFALDVDRALALLVGHPLVFDARDRSRRLELVAYPVELLVRERARGYHIALSHSADRPSVFLEAETPTRWRVIEITPALLKVQALLGPQGLQVPKAARDRVVALVQRDTPTLPIRAEIADIDLPAIDGDPAPVVQMQPVEGGARVVPAVRPFGPAGPHYLPGQGGHSVLATLDGERRRANRDLAREKAERAALVAACPALAERGADEPEWIIEGTEAVLEFLEQLHAYPQPLSVEWPEGQKLAVAGAELSAAKLSMKIGQGRDWFHIAGSLAVDDDLVVDLRDLLDRLEHAHGRFVPLGDGRFVALTRHFQAQLQRLKGVSEGDKTGRRVSRLGGLAVRGLVEEAGQVKTDKSWRDFVERLDAAETFTPQVPATLQAELRDYQVEGFAWMARLARWGAGACLADDMGLGKTVQAIAVMLTLAGEGPCLVVAPTSVCGNWVAELSRFAPTLTPHRLASAGDRAALVQGLGPRDVLIASYGLLHQEADLLAPVAWRMAVFDEAQALKNAETKRTQASQAIEAGFRLALSGTPIENDLDELWSLFNVVNPGLLGSREGFQKRFATPIQRDRDAQARHALKELIRPFILRRTKSAVLSELPPRIEQTLVVEPGPEERAFHTALREKALETIAKLREEGAGARKLHILAEITRLRRACCDPALVAPDAEVGSAKVAAFLELVDELRANRHRALVFSQFVGFLGRVRADLDALGVSYQYLDGSTPARDREKRVAAFQAGEGDLFLISLKAGGTGLNLTAADYVIHLDPWWNPAVEDQATDRAHRIGQHRPVTVYRLIVQDSIEEKILALHRDKRDLAADLLEGTEIAGRLGEEDLLALIRA